MERKCLNKFYTVYKITSPNKKIYVGYTSQNLKERWRQHRTSALSLNNPERLFYIEIRECNGDGFTIEELCTTNNKYSAMLLEEEFIASIPNCVSVNMTRGGRYDSIDGAQIFWKRINEDQAKRDAYLKKLSEAKKSKDWSDYEQMLQKALEWRKSNPREAYRLSYRAIRIANKIRGVPPPCHMPVDDAPLKERLMHKFRLNDVKSKYVQVVWANRSSEEKEAIAKKISVAQKNHMATLSTDERKKVTEKARAAIDVSIQSVASSKGLKAWWAQLKQDPERYNEYMKRRTASFKQKMLTSKNSRSSKE